VLSPLRVAKSNSDLGLLPAMANRHGLIAGATGTGKTVTLQTLAERFSAIGVPVFMADVKGDLAGLAAAGGTNAKVAARVKSLGVEGFEYRASPVMLWDVFGARGHPVRATISEMGPLLVARILDLNETQAGVLAAVFKIADDHGMLLLDLKDLRSMLQFAAENASQFRTQYGNISTASVGAIQRGLLTLESQGGDRLFGEPALALDDLMQTVDGKGVINILAADQLLSSPRVYATLLLWLLSELFENLPEVGDPEKPKLVFFFDEAHLLFNDAPKELLNRIEQVVRLVRSKGVGVYFVTQNPLDVPDTVLGQLGNRVQHALRAFTPRDQAAVKSAATTFRANAKVDVEQAITELEVGEALVSFLDEKGAPRPVERAYVYPPASRLGPLSAEERRAVIAGSLVAGHYEKAVDRDSAHEQLKARTQAKGADAAPAAGGSGSILDTLGIPGTGGGGRGRTRETAIEAAAKSAARAIGSEVGRRIIRGVLGSIFGGRR
jgi:DNA helicase HerA-like ATPase